MARRSPLDALLDDYGISRERLAAEAGVSMDTVQRRCAGKRKGRSANLLLRPALKRLIPAVSEETLDALLPVRALARKAS